MRILILAAFTLLISACGAKKDLGIKSLLPSIEQAPVEVTQAPSNPQDFEKSVPTSSILRQSLVVFENTYPRVYSDSGVLSAATQDNIIALLKETALEFSMPYCSSLVTKGGDTDILLEEGVALVYGKTDITLYSLADCVKYSSMKRLLKGRVMYVQGAVIEWEGSRVAMREAVTGKEVYEGDTGIPIFTAGVMDGSIVLVHSGGYVMVYDINVRFFVLKGKFPVDFSLLNFSNGVFCGILKTSGNYFTLSKDGFQEYPYQDCRLSFSSPYAMCGEGKVLVGVLGEYGDVPPSKRFTANNLFLADLIDGNINIFSLTPSWQRFLRFDYNLPKPCIASDGSIYFTNFEGEIIKLLKDTQVMVDAIPEKCNTKGVIFQNNAFLCGGKICGTFAEKIISDGEISLFRRIENGKRYYYVL